MTDLQKKFEQFIRKNHLIHRRDKIALAVSGGMDSMTLLELFSRIRSKWDLSLTVVHIQHGIRGKDAEADEDFVQEMSGRYGLPFLTFQVDAPAYSKLNKISLETGARELRYALFHSIMNELSLDRIALAHHADDQAETILLHLVRGTGLKGIAGMLPVNEGIIRPLLFAAREEIESFVLDNHIAYRTDLSNQDTYFRRNRMRWNIVTKLKTEFGTHVTQSICRAGQAAFEAKSYIDSEAQKILKRRLTSPTPDQIVLDIHQFLRYFKAIQKTVLIHVFQLVPFIHRIPSYHELERILWIIENGKSGAVLQLNPNVSIVKSGSHLVWKKKTSQTTEYALIVGRRIELKETGVCLSSTLLPMNPAVQFSRENKRTVFLDYDLVKQPLLLRFYKPGDWFIPLGMKGKKKLQDFFVDEKVPNYRRAQIPLILSNHSIAWVAGYRLDERFKVTDQTTTVLKIEMSQI